MPNPLIRIVQRYLIPRWVVAIYYSLRYKCLVSLQTRIQLSNQISFGKGSVVKPYVVINTQGGKIRIGKNCAISSFNHISTGMKDVIIGDYVRIAPNVTILGGSRNFQKRDVLIMKQGSSHEGLQIGTDILIGANVVILPGCHIGEGAVIGAGSVVTGEVPPYTIVAGTPAKIIGRRE